MTNRSQPDQLATVESVPSAGSQNTERVVAYVGIAAIAVSLAIIAGRFFDADKLELRPGLAGLALLVGLACFGVLLRLNARRAARGLREQTYERALEASPDAFVLTDEGGLVLEWNRAAEELFGIPREDARGRSLAEVILPEGERDALWDLRPDHPSRPQYVLGQRAEGSRAEFEILTTPFQDGPRRLFSHFIRDVTEQRAAEAQRVQAQRTEAVGQLTGEIAHVFNNLLTVLSGNLELLASGAGAKERALIEPAAQAAQRAAQLVRQLLAFAQRQRLANEWVDVNKTIESMAGSLKGAVGAAIEVTLHLEASSEACLVDEVQLKSALLNVALNARDAMADQPGRLTIETRDVVLDQRAGVMPGDYLRITLTDTGVGMSSELIEHAFEPFFTTKPRGAGAGLGLSMAYGFVKRSGGHVTIQSDLGHGACLQIYLPRAGKAARSVGRAQDTAAAPRARPTTRGVVLVVEDRDIIRPLATASVESLGYAVIRTSSGSEALEILERGERVDVLFSDVVMPGGMSGVELADQVSRQYPDIKILLTSGHTIQIAPNLSEVGAAAAFVSKPYTRKDLATAFRSLSAG